MVCDPATPMNACHLTILHQLTTGPKTGQELVDGADGAEGALQRGTVYVHLATLEDQGLLTSEDIPRNAEGFRARRYTITDAGRELVTDESPGEGFVCTSKPGAGFERWARTLTAADKKALDVGDFFTPSTMRVMGAVVARDLTPEEGTLLTTPQPSMWRALASHIALLIMAFVGFVAMGVAQDIGHLGAFVDGFLGAVFVLTAAMLCDHRLRRYRDEALRRALARRRWAEVQAERSKREASP